MIFLCEVVSEGVRSFRELCGPLPSASFYGFKYFLTFIDDYSRRTWVYFLKLKSEVFDKFLAYKSLVEKQFKLISDNGGEYVNNKFTTFCSKRGIKKNMLFHIHHINMVSLSEITTP